MCNCKGANTLDSLDRFGQIWVKIWHQTYFLMEKTFIATWQLQIQEFWWWSFLDQIWKDISQKIQDKMWHQSHFHVELTFIENPALTFEPINYIFCCSAFGEFNGLHIFARERQCCWYFDFAAAGFLYKLKRVTKKKLTRCCVIRSNFVSCHPQNPRKSKVK